MHRYIERQRNIISEIYKDGDRERKKEMIYICLEKQREIMVLTYVCRKREKSVIDMCKDGERKRKREDIHTHRKTKRKNDTYARI